MANDRLTAASSNLFLGSPAARLRGASRVGVGAGIFFFGYFIFEVPSNLILERVGARRWIARIMISWGVISASFAFVPSISAFFQGLGISW
jgi:MFS family permease